MLARIILKEFQLNSVEAIYDDFRCSLLTDSFRSVRRGVMFFSDSYLLFLDQGTTDLGTSPWRVKIPWANVLSAQERLYRKFPVAKKRVEVECSNVEDIDDLFGLQAFDSSARFYEALELLKIMCRKNMYTTSNSVAEESEPELPPGPLYCNNLEAHLTDDGELTERDMLSTAVLSITSVNRFFEAFLADKPELDLFSLQKGVKAFSKTDWTDDWKRQINFKQKLGLSAEASIEQLQQLKFSHETIDESDWLILQVKTQARDIPYGETFRVIHQWRVYHCRSLPQKQEQQHYDSDFSFSAGILVCGRRIQDELLQNHQKDDVCEMIESAHSLPSLNGPPDQVSSPKKTSIRVDILGSVSFLSNSFMSSLIAKRSREESKRAAANMLAAAQSHLPRKPSRATYSYAHGLEPITDDLEFKFAKKTQKRSWRCNFLFNHLLLKFNSRQYRNATLQILAMFIVLAIQLILASKIDALNAKFDAMLLALKNSQ